MARTPTKSSPVIKEQTVSQTPEQRYKATKGRLANLLTSEDSARNRSNWLILANEFNHLFLHNKKQELATSALFMQARTYHLMHARFQLLGDAETARKAYLQLADLYPGHSLGDDSLFKAAELSSVVSDKLPTAEALYQQIVSQYPQGDYFVKAQQFLKAVPEPQPESPPEMMAKSIPPKVATPTKPLSTTAPSLAQIGQTKFWSSELYSRVVINSDTKIPYSIRQENNLLLLDLQKSSIDPAYCRTLQFTEGLLRQVETTQAEKEVVRLQLGLNRVTDYKVFTLDDPFRLVVDVYGAPSSETSTPIQALASVPAPTLEPKSMEPRSIPILNDQKKINSSSAPSIVKLPREHLSLAQQLGLGVKTIVIDPGHGGKDPGAMAFGLKEKDIVLDVAKKLAKILTDTFHYQVILTRTKDVYVPLERRTAIANAKKADLFVSIHINAHSNQANSGIETYFLNLATDADAMRVAALENASSTHSIGELQDILSSLMNNSKIDESSRLARFIQTNLINGFSNSYKPRDLGVKQAPFYVLIGAEMPAILAELSFITNPQEAVLLKENSHLDKIAQQLAGGIVAYIDHHRAAVRLP